MNIFHLRRLFLKHKAFGTEDCKSYPRPCNEAESDCDGRSALSNLTMNSAASQTVHLCNAMTMTESSTESRFPHLRHSTMMVFIKAWLPSDRESIQTPALSYDAGRSSRG